MLKNIRMDMKVERDVRKLKDNMYLREDTQNIWDVCDLYFRNTTIMKDKGWQTHRFPKHPYYILFHFS
jgi:hypothetical protein